MSKLRQLTSILCLLVFALGGCSKLNREHYAKLKIGQDYTEVVKILGKPDTCSETLMAKNCIWGNERQNITVKFLGNKVLLFSNKNID